MLRELHVRNLAVVASASVELNEGLNALTGETGAGKSIVVDSMALLAGARASAELIRSGADRLTVTGVFQPTSQGWRERLEEAGIEVDGDELLVRREVSRTGRNRVFVNDQPTTLRLLADLAPALLRIHGQHEELGLTTPDLQRHWLDRSGGAKAKTRLAEVAAAYAAWSALTARLDKATGSERSRQERLDLLHFQAQEIDAAQLVAGEEEALRQEREVLRHAETIVSNLGGALDLVVDAEGAAAARVARARLHLAEIEGWEPRAKEWGIEAEELRIRLEELGHDLRQRHDEVRADPARLNQVEDRLVTVERLCFKHGSTSQEVLAYRQEIAAELAELEVDEEGRAHLQAELAAALDAYRKAALELSKGRSQWGSRLARAVRAELGELGLGKAALEVRLERRKRADSPLELAGERVEFGPEGLDRVVFTFAPNPGEEARPLSRVASGGELSRIYLALQLAVRGSGAAMDAALVFDEVDAGVGGAEAAALGKKLQRLAGGGQVLAVTHLPQVASHADRQLKVAKRTRGGRTFTEVLQLDEEERVDEVARMLAGSEVTELSRSHAREMINAAARDAVARPVVAR